MGVEDLTAWRAGARADAVPAAFRALLPTTTYPAWVHVVVSDVGLAYVSAIRRGVLEETPGYALDIPDSARLETNDQHYATDIANNLRSLPLDISLDAQDASAVRLQLAARNDTAAYVPLTSAALVPAPNAPAVSLFNTTVAIGPPLQPGGYVAIDDIRVVSGVGRVAGNPAASSELDPIKATLGHPGFSAACRATLLSLDADPNAESSLVAEPRRHQLRFKLKAVGADADLATAAKRFLIRVCTALRARLQVKAIADGRRLRVAEDEGVLDLPGETASISKVLVAAILETHPDVTFAGDVEVRHDASVRVKFRHPDEDLGTVLSDAVTHAIGIFTQLEEDLRRAPARVLAPGESLPNVGKRVPPPAAVFEDDHAGAVGRYRE